MFSTKLILFVLFSRLLLWKKMNEKFLKSSRMVTLNISSLNEEELFEVSSDFMSLRECWDQKLWEPLLLGLREGAGLFIGVTSTVTVCRCIFLKLFIFFWGGILWSSDWATWWCFGVGSDEGACKPLSSLGRLWVHLLASIPGCLPLLHSTWWPCCEAFLTSFSRE